MRTRAVLPAVLSIMLLAASASAETEPRRFRSVVHWVDPIKDLNPEAVASEHISKIIFINRCAGGCTITPGENDALRNTSSIPLQTSQISEFAFGDEVFDAVVACVRDVYAPYDVEIVTVDPGESAFHHEAILAGSPGEVGLDGSIGGIAPGSCSPLNNVISYSFANSMGSNVERLCWTVAQESAHSFGLPNHVFDCTDPMTYLDGCERKYFRNQDLPCGEFALNVPSCQCGITRQNSHRTLREVFGDGVQPPPPTVDLFAPTDGVTVTAADFDIAARASDPRLVSRVELWVNGTRYETLDGHAVSEQFRPYAFRAPNHPDGYMDIEVKAYNDLGSEGIGAATVLKGAACVNESTCFEGMMCTDGRCKYPPPTQEFGDECNIDQDCTTGLCPKQGDTGYCSRTCISSVADSCPMGFECRDEGVCWPEGEGGGGCCSVAGGHVRGPLTYTGLALFGVLFFFVRRRRSH